MWSAELCGVIAGSGKAGVDLSDFERRMADVLKSKVPEIGKVLVLTGNAHARLTPMSGYTRCVPFPLIAAFGLGMGEGIRLLWATAAGIEVSERFLQ